MLVRAPVWQHPKHPRHPHLSTQSPTKTKIFVVGDASMPSCFRWAPMGPRASKQLPSSPSRLPAVYLAAKEGQPQGEHLLSPSPHPQLSEPEPETPPLLPHPPAVQTCDWTRSDRPWTGLQCFGVLQNAGALQHVTIQRCRQPGLQACESIWGNNVASCNITTVTTVTFDHLQNIQFSSSFKPVSPIIQY